MKRKSFFVAVILVLVLSMGLVNQAWASNAIGGKRQPIAAQFLPKQSPLVFSVLVNPDRLTQVAKQGTKSSDRHNLEQELKTLKQQLKQIWSIDYDQDLQAWLGEEVTVAVTTTDLDHELANGLQPGYLLALAVKAPNIPIKCLDAFWQKQAIAGADLKFEQYQGVSLVSATNYDQDSVITGTAIGKFVIFANDLKVLRTAINNLQAPNLALSNNINYQESLQQLGNNRVALSYVNFNQLKQWVANSGSAIASLVNQLPLSRLTLGWGIENFGIKAETILAVDSRFEPQATKTIDQNTSLQYIPSGSSVITGRDLSQNLEIITNTVAPYPQLKLALTTLIAKISDRLNHPELEKLQWLDGDYAIAFLPQISSDRPNWLMVAENTNSELVSSSLKQLDQNASDTFTVAEIIVNNYPIKVWTKLTSTNGVVTGSVTAAHAEIGDRIFVANSVEAIVSALDAPIKHESIISSDRPFQAIADSISAQSFIYLNNPINIPINFSSEYLPINFLQPLLHHIESTAIATTGAKVTAQTTYILGEIISNLR